MAGRPEGFFSLGEVFVVFYCGCICVGTTWFVIAELGRGSGGLALFFFDSFFSCLVVASPGRDGSTANL